MPPKSPVMNSSGGNVKGNIGAGGVAASQASNLASQSQIVTSQAQNGSSMLGGQMQIISPLQVLQFSFQLPTVYNVLILFYSVQQWASPLDLYLQV